MRMDRRLTVLATCIAAMPWASIVVASNAPTVPAASNNTCSEQEKLFALVGSYHLTLPSSSFPMSSVDLSPDGTSIFTFEEGRGLWISKFAPMSPALLSEQRLLPRPAHHVPFTWTRDSNEILGARQAINHSGFAIGPLKAFSITGKGAVAEFPPLTSASGGLDEIFWIGRDGRAVAAFGTRGSFYRPERSNLQPSMAIVNARTGRVLQEVKIRDFPSVAVSSKIEFVSGLTDEAGRVHIVAGLSPNHWISWIQGKQPQLLPISEAIEGKPVALSPDGRSLLVMQNLSARGVICEHDPNCPRPTPSHGDVAKLLDLSNGRTIWSIRGVAKNWDRSIRPAISADGRYALISMPEENGKSPIAIVLVSSGEIIQKLPALESRHRSVGFFADGRRAWTIGGSELNIYAIP